MSTIDIGAAERPLARIHSPRATPFPASMPATPASDAGDFYIGSTKISTLSPLNTAQAARITPTN